MTSLDFFSRHPLVGALLAVGVFGCSFSPLEDESEADSGTESPLPEGKHRAEATAALASSLVYFHDTLAQRGGYVWTYALDLSRRWAEGEATPDQIGAQPPGTPAIGLLFVDAYEVTGDSRYLDYAEEAAVALTHGQLESGGWANFVDFDPNGDRAERYRNGLGNPNGKNNSTLDDDITQSILRLLARLDRTTGGGNPTIRDAVEFGFNALLSAQFAHGGFPQVFDERGVFDLAVLPATIPDPYPRTSQNPDYWDYPQINDDVAAEVLDTLLVAHESFDDPTYLDAALKLGEFFLLAQLPDPQPAWAQQYNEVMEPAWARRFEPPAVTGLESQQVMDRLLHLYRLTGDVRFIDAVGRALPYLASNILPDGQLNRFYELGTNLPLYMERDSAGNYSLTYSDANLPSHYGWKFPSRLGEIEADYNALRANPSAPRATQDFDELEADVARIIDELDPSGRWVDFDIKVASGIPQGDYILSSTFVDNAGLLVEYLRRTRAP